MVFQLTYSMTRFAMYESAKKQLQSDGKAMPFYQKVLVAAISGATGGFVGTPADMVNVRWVGRKFRGEHFVFKKKTNKQTRNTLCGTLLLQ